MQAPVLSSIQTSLSCAWAINVNRRTACLGQHRVCSLAWRNLKRPVGDRLPQVIHPLLTHLRDAVEMRLQFLYGVAAGR